MQSHGVVALVVSKLGVRAGDEDNGLVQVGVGRFEGRLEEGAELATESRLLPFFNHRGLVADGGDERLVVAVEKAVPVAERLVLLLLSG